jgi:hypothetical protein
MSYALRLYTWTEARLTREGLLEGAAGEMLGTPEQVRGPRVPPGGSRSARASSGEHGRVSNDAAQFASIRLRRSCVVNS